MSPGSDDAGIRRCETISGRYEGSAGAVSFVVEVPESTALVTEAGSREPPPFRPQPPWTTADGERPVGREV